jgi:hypothetical protein
VLISTMKPSRSSSTTSLFVVSDASLRAYIRLIAEHICGNLLSVMMRLAIRGGLLLVFSMPIGRQLDGF